MFIAEHWMSEVAVTCGLPAEEVSWEFGGTGQSGPAYFEGQGLCILDISPGGRGQASADERAQKLDCRICPHLTPTRP